MVRQRLLIALLALSALSLAGDCRNVRVKTQGPGEVIALLQPFADRFVPFVPYPLDNCFAVWPDTGELLAALEIHRLDPSLGIEPELAGPYVRHMAESVLAQIYDPDDPDTWGPCRY
ncbi:MAG: hypothetical protein O7G30_13825, partial [Proteobacteria bacterium]|nr:hypothetical protein [Pseudomonadota bacterium]